MTKVLVLYYSSYGHIETMAYAVAEGVKSAGAEVVVKRVPELVPEEVAKSSHFKLDQAAPSRLLTNWQNTMPSSSAPAPASARLPHRCGISGTRPAVCGSAASLSARSALPSPRRPRSTAVRIDHPWFPPHLPAPRHGRCRSALCLPGPDGRR